MGKKILEDILTEKPRNGHRGEGERGGCGTRLHGNACVGTHDKRAKGAREASMERRWTKRPKRGKGAARTGGSRGRSRDLGIPNPHLIRESRFPLNNPLFSNRFNK